MVATQSCVSELVGTICCSCELLSGVESVHKLSRKFLFPPLSIHVPCSSLLTVEYIPIVYRF